MKEKDVCNFCKGSCCKSFIIPLPAYWRANEEIRGWIASHNGIVMRGADVEINSKCSYLNETGQCSIYGGRPKLCQAFKVGGQDCLNAVRKHNAENYETIVAMIKEMKN